MLSGGIGEGRLFAAMEDRLVGNSTVAIYIIFFLVKRSKLSTSALTLHD